MGILQATRYASREEETGIVERAEPVIYGKKEDVVLDGGGSGQFYCFEYRIEYAAFDIDGSGGVVDVI